MELFKVGYCPNCGAQSQTTDTRAGIIAGQVGSYLCWLCICDEDGNVKTRIGTFALCKDCPPDEVDPADIEASLVGSPFSGITNQEPELLNYPNRMIEKVLRYGD